MCDDATEKEQKLIIDGVEKSRSSAMHVPIFVDYLYLYHRSFYVCG